MFSMTRVRLAALFLIAAAVLAGGAAPALGAGCDLAPIGDEPNAFGTATLSGLKYAGPGEWPYVYYVGNLSVTCRDLTPGATYTVNYMGFVFGQFTADANGNGATKARIYVRAQVIVVGKKHGVAFDFVHVTVQRDAGPTVLEGSFYPR